MGAAKRKIGEGREHDQGHFRMIMTRSMMEVERAAKRAGNTIQLVLFNLRTNQFFMFICSRDKKYSKKSPKRDYRDRSREKYSNGGRKGDRYDRDKDYYHYSSKSKYNDDKYSKHSSSRNGDRHAHRSRR